MTLRKTLTSIVLAGAISLSGCGYQIPQYQISQEVFDKIVEEPVKEWVKTSDNYMNVYQLVREGHYDEAQTVLEGYMRQQIREGAEYKGVINGTDKVSKTAAERIGKTIDGQIDKIQTYLKE